MEKFFSYFSLLVFFISDFKICLKNTQSGKIAYPSKIVKKNTISFGMDSALGKLSAEIN